MSKNRDSNDKNKSKQNYMRYVGVSTQLVAISGFGIWLGIWLDKQIGWTPLFLILCPVLAITGAMYIFIKSFLSDHSDKKT